MHLIKSIQIWLTLLCFQMLTLNLHKNTRGIDGSGYWKCTSLIDNLNPNLNYVLESEKKNQNFFYLKVSKSRKQFMVSWILPKNEHWISALEVYYFKVNTKRESMFFLQEDRLSFVLTLK